MLICCLLPTKALLIRSFSVSWVSLLKEEEEEEEDDKDED
jgi:hypothetical protein